MQILILSDESRNEFTAAHMATMRDSDDSDTRVSVDGDQI